MNTPQNLYSSRHLIEPHNVHLNKELGEFWNDREDNPESANDILRLLLPLPDVLPQHGEVLLVDVVDRMPMSKVNTETTELVSYY